MSKSPGLAVGDTLPSVQHGLFCPPEYTSWAQPSGYFDGDGTVVVRVQRFTLEFGLQFSDGYSLQLLQLKTFMNERGVITGEITKHSFEEMYVLRVAEDQSLLKAAKNMLPFSSKKAAELYAVVKYMENQINGNQAIEVFNRMVIEGERIGKIRVVDLPYTYSEGMAIARKMAHEASRIKLAKLRFKDQILIQLRHRQGERVAKLAEEFGVSDSTIRKALRGEYQPI